MQSFSKAVGNTQRAGVGNSVTLQGLETVCCGKRLAYLRVVSALLKVVAVRLPLARVRCLAVFRVAQLAFLRQNLPEWPLGLRRYKHIFAISLLGQPFLA